MKPEPLCHGDISAFLELASAEGWLVASWELEFLLEIFPAGCRVIRDENGRAIAMVTAVLHQRSGWIGNLIVAPRFRGRGLGEALFLAAMNALIEAGVSTIWLTASTMGMKLYRKHGFNRIDTIVRWIGNGQALKEKNEEIPVPVAVTDQMLALDALSWGDCREGLLSAVVSRGEFLSAEDGCVVIQPVGADLQLGPFVALNEQSAAEMLESSLQKIKPEASVCVDAPGSNKTAFKLFSNVFRIAGSNELMYFGEKPLYRPELLYGLATMGSCG